MSPIVMRSIVDREGVLNLSLPLGLSEANHEVQVTVELLREKPAITDIAWSDWVDSMAGSWQGDFERPPQTEFETRESFS